MVQFRIYFQNLRFEASYRQKNTTLLGPEKTLDYMQKLKNMESYLKITKCFKRNRLCHRCFEGKNMQHFILPSHVPKNYQFMDLKRDMNNIERL